MLLAAAAEKIKIRTYESNILFVPDDTTKIQDNIPRTNFYELVFFSTTGTGQAPSDASVYGMISTRFFLCAYRI